MTTFSKFPPRSSTFSISTPAKVSSSARSSIFAGSSTNSRSQLTENFILSRVGWASRPPVLASRENNLEKFANARTPSPAGETPTLPERYRHSRELPQETQIVLREETKVGNSEKDHGEPI